MLPGNRSTAPTHAERQNEATVSYGGLAALPDSRFHWMVGDHLHVPESIFWGWWAGWYIPTIPTLRRMKPNFTRKDSNETKDFQEVDVTNSQVTLTSLPTGLKLHPADLQSHCPRLLTRVFSAHPLQYHLWSLSRLSLKGWETQGAAPCSYQKGRRQGINKTNKQKVVWVGLLVSTQNLIHVLFLEHVIRPYLWKKPPKGLGAQGLDPKWEFKVLRYDHKCWFPQWINLLMDSQFDAIRLQCRNWVYK